MAVTIKLKNASGSDPSASDLVVGEVAIRTDNGKLFTKKDDNSVAEISGGGIDDGDKGDITVSNSGATFTIDNEAVTLAKIQHIQPNHVLGRISSSNGDVEQLTAANIRTIINVENGATNVTNTNQLTNGAGFITATLTNEQVQDIVGGMVTGNTESGITVTYQDGDGTLDFSVASQTDNNFTNADHSKLDGIEAGATADQSNSEIKTAYEANSNTNAFTDAFMSKLTNIAAGATNVTNTNQLTNGAGFITATLTNEQVQDIVGGMVSGNTESGITVTYQDGDGTLDFSVASQTDNNFTNADHSKLDGIEAGATADQSASEILTLIKTVDGSGSGLDADLLDGANASVSAGNNTIVKRHSSGYIFANYFNTTPNTVSSGVTQVCVETGNDGYIRHGTAAAIRTFINVADGANNITNNNQLTNGAGYITSASFSDVAGGGTFTGDIDVSGGAGAINVNANSDIRFTNGNWTGDSTKIQHHSNFLYMQGGSNGIIFRASGGSNRWIIDSSGHLDVGADSTYDIGASGTRVRNGYFDTLYGDGSNLTGISAGATGGGSDEVFYENSQTITTNYTITNGKNAMSAGPITINSGVTVTVGSGENWTVV